MGTTIAPFLNISTTSKIIWSCLIPFNGIPGSDHITIILIWDQNNSIHFQKLRKNSRFGNRIFSYISLKGFSFFHFVIRCYMWLIQKKTLWSERNIFIVIYLKSFHFNHKFKNKNGPNYFFNYPEGIIPNPYKGPPFDVVYFLLPSFCSLDWSFI